MTIEVKIYLGKKSASRWLRAIAELLEGLPKDNDGDYLYVSLTNYDPAKKDC